MNEAGEELLKLLEELEEDHTLNQDQLLERFFDEAKNVMGENYDKVGKYRVYALFKSRLDQIRNQRIRNPDRTL